MLFYLNKIEYKHKQVGIRGVQLSVFFRFIHLGIDSVLHILRWRFLFSRWGNSAQNVFIAYCLNYFCYYKNTLCDVYGGETMLFLYL